MFTSLEALNLHLIGHIESEEEVTVVSHFRFCVMKKEELLVLFFVL